MGCQKKGCNCAEIQEEKATFEPMLLAVYEIPSISCSAAQNWEYGDWSLSTL